MPFFIYIKKIYEKEMNAMSINEMPLEEFIYSPDTVAMILRSELITRDFMERHPNVRLGKVFPFGFTIIYVGMIDYERLSREMENSVTYLFPYAMGLLGLQAMDAAGIIQVQNQPFLDLSGRGVLLGFVDTGIDYTKRAFQYEDGTSKIQYIWDQSIPGSPPDGYLYGSEYDNAKINEALRADDPLSVVPHTDTVGHGTFLASVAGSREPGEYLGAAPDAEIIAVKLKRARPAEYQRFLIPIQQENTFSSDDLIMGLQYIIDKAAQLKRPVAICISIGSNLGSRNGLGRLEETISRMAGATGVIFCAAAGNESAAKHHTHGKLIATGSTHTIELKSSVQLEDIFLQIWNNPTDRMSVSITSPAGEQIIRIPARSGNVYRTKLIMEPSTVVVEYMFPINRNGEQLTRVKIMSSSPGVWKITLHGDVINDGTFHAWLPLTGFINPGTVFLSPTPNYTIVTPATTMGIIACGAYNSIDNSLYSSTSWGPTRIPSISPDLVAPGVDVSGIYPSGYGTMSGTSVAAAIVTGACALMLQWGIVEKNDLHMDSFRARARLIEGCARDPNINYPNNQWGYGKLNLMNTFRAIRPI